MAKSLRRSASKSKSKKTTTKRRSSKTALKLNKNTVKRNNNPSNLLNFLYEKAWLSEIIAVLLFISVVFITLSFISEFLFIDLLSSSKNIMGPIGKAIAVLLGGFFGWSIFIPLTALVICSAHLWSISSEKDNAFEIEIKSFPLLVIGFIALTFSSAVIFSIFWGRFGGGDFGNTIALPLKTYTNTFGATLITFGFSVLALTCILQKSSKDVLFSLVESSFSLIIKIVTSMLDGIILGFVYFIELLKKLFLKSDYEEYEDEEEEKTPKPKIRKNKLEEQWYVNKSKSNVLVSRRKPDRNKKLKLKHSVVNNTPYIMPDTKLLSLPVEEPSLEDDDVLKQKSFLIEEKLADFGIKGRVTEVHPGPVITLFEFEPAPGVKVGKITALQDDLAMSLKASAIRIIAPLPKKGTVGIEVPNKRRELVSLREVLESEAFINAENPLTIAVGKDTYGDPVAIDIATMPHLLIAGATGTGKSVCINTLLLSLLYRSTPEELGLILIDPKILELSVYEGIPHLKVPVVTAPKQARAVLEWAVKEMDKRYRLMQKYGVRSIDGYNQLVKGDDAINVEKIENNPELVEEGIFGVEVAPLTDEDSTETKLNGIAKEELKPLSKLVIVIDELADLMLSVGKDIEDLIARLAQKARAAGIHLIVATQRPSVDVITGLIKANFPARMSFRVTSRVDSRTILDSMGAEKLLGRGDMLFRLPGFIHAQRAHGAFVSDEEVNKVIDAIKKQSPPQYDPEIINICEKALKEDEDAKAGITTDEDYDELYDKAVEFVMQQGQASTSSVQRAFRIGYNRAARIIDTMEREGIIGPINGAKPREIMLETGEYDEDADDKF